jgi:hypothetical protein
VAYSTASFWTSYLRSVGEGLGTFLPRDLPRGAASPPSKSSHGASGSWGPAKPTVRVEKVTTVINLPKDSDAGYARRIAQLVKSEDRYDGTAVASRTSRNNLRFVSTRKGAT